MNFLSKNAKNDLVPPYQLLLFFVFCDLKWNIWGFLHCLWDKTNVKSSLWALVNSHGHYFLTFYGQNDESNK